MDKPRPHSSEGVLRNPPTSLTVKIKSRKRGREEREKKKKKDHGGLRNSRGFLPASLPGAFERYAVTRARITLAYCTSSWAPRLHRKWPRSSSHPALLVPHSGFVPLYFVYISARPERRAAHISGSHAALKAGVTFSLHQTRKTHESAVPLCVWPRGTGGRTRHNHSPWTPELKMVLLIQYHQPQ